jgi:hypothetical protein
MPAAGQIVRAAAITRKVEPGRACTEWWSRAEGQDRALREHGWQSGRCVLAAPGGWDASCAPPPSAVTLRVAVAGRVVGLGGRVTRCAPPPCSRNIFGSIRSTTRIGWPSKHGCDLTFRSSSLCRPRWGTMSSWQGVCHNQRIGCAHGARAVRRSHGLWPRSISRRSTIYGQHAIARLKRARWSEWQEFFARLFGRRNAR